MVCRCDCWRISRKHANGCGKIQPTARVHPAAKRRGSARQRATRRRATKPMSRRAPRCTMQRNRMRPARPRTVGPTHPRSSPPSARRPSPRRVSASPASPLVRPGSDAPSVAYAGFQSIDLRWGDAEHPGLHLHITDHRFHDGLCGCGHHTRARPGVGLVEDPRLEPVAVSEWRLVGPGLVQARFAAA